MLTSQFSFDPSFGISSTAKAFICRTCDEPAELHGMHPNSADPAVGRLW